ncbi:MAG: hypothetical protein APF76_14665 [Desulfitibacter sp. BRH_c19]|nr:MAG: hypothetical protein APF76_14665 [Desulfitibacter sp. BRH_c19]
MNFISPSKGPMPLQGVLEDILDFMETKPDEKFNLIIGTDSHTKTYACFVTAIIIHQVGKGARYYYHKKRQRKIASLRQKLFYEAAISLETASKVADFLAKRGQEKLNVEIHLDMGNQGETRSLIKEIVGMVSGSGFNAKIKPDSCGASTVADKHTKF